jgi:uncharacterized membrane protein
MSVDKKLKHLEFIQNVITRMNSNSFMIKGWAVTIVAALFALSDKTTTSEHHLYLIAFIPVPIFWFLDGFFIVTERRFRNLYKFVSKIDEDNIDFNMNPYFDVVLIEHTPGQSLTKTEQFKNWWKLNWNKLKEWFKGTFSITLILFYGVMLVLMFVVKYWLNV